MRCLNIQPIGPMCMTPSCNGFSMAKYYCNICKFFDDERYLFVRWNPKLMVLKLLLSINMSHRGGARSIVGLLELGYSGQGLTLVKEHWEDCQTLAERGAELFTHDSRKKMKNLSRESNTDLLKPYKRFPGILCYDQTHDSLYIRNSKSNDPIPNKERKKK